MKRFNIFATALIAAWSLVAPVAFASDEVDFFRAAQVDNTRTVRKLLEKGLNPNVKEPLRGDTALIVALRDDGNKVAELLLAQPGIDLEASSANGDTALMMAAYKHNRKAVDMLLDKGAQLNREGWTALHYAVAAGDVAIASLFIGKGAKIDAASPTGMTPLMLAAREGKDETVKLLLAAGANTRLKSSSGMDASRYAMSIDRKDIVDMIAAHVAATGAPVR